MNTQPITRQLLTLVSVMRSIADATVINYRRMAAELSPEYRQAALELIVAREAELDASFAAIRAEIDALA